MIEGRHVKVIGHTRLHPELLASEANVRDVVQALVAACGMRLLGGVHTYDVAIEIGKLAAEPFEDEGGVTAVGVLSTSHCAIHTWPARGLFVLDVYSCRYFDVVLVCDVLRKYFERPGEAPLDMNATDVSHALEMPESWRLPLTTPAA